MADRAVVRSPIALGQELARLRYDRGLTQVELADALGVDRRYVYELERGKENLFATRLFEALRELGAHLLIVSDTGDTTGPTRSSPSGTSGPDDP